MGPEGGPERALAPRSGERGRCCLGLVVADGMWMLLWLLSPALSFPAAALQLLSAPLCCLSQSWMESLG